MPIPTWHPVTDDKTSVVPEKDRRPTLVPPSLTPSPELPGRPRRRSFSAQEKLRILAETDRAAQAGGIGAVLGREGICSSLLTDWRRQQDAGVFNTLPPSQRGPKLLLALLNQGGGDDMAINGGSNLFGLNIKKLSGLRYGHG